MSLADSISYSLSQLTTGGIQGVLHDHWKKPLESGNVCLVSSRLHARFPFVDLAL